MSKVPAILVLFLIAGLALVWGWALNTAFAGESDGNLAGGRHYVAQENTASLHASESSVVPNQRITLRGEHFSPDATLSSIVIGAVNLPGSDSINLPGSRINDGDDVSIDSDGNWSAKVDLPHTDSLLSPLSRDIVATDSEGVSGRTRVSGTEPRLSVRPDSGPAGSAVTVRGRSFPAGNDDGDSVSIRVGYLDGDAVPRNYHDTWTIEPDGDGDFELEITVPDSVSAPSDNIIDASFGILYEQYGYESRVGYAVDHSVPAAATPTAACRPRRQIPG